jgi:hypothetical protein
MVYSNREYAERVLDLLLGGTCWDDFGASIVVVCCYERC